MLLNCKKITRFCSRSPACGPERYDFYLQPLDRIHLYSMQDYGTAELNAGDITRCYMLLFVGLLVLLIACINYINLITARSANRLREVGFAQGRGCDAVAIDGSIFG